MSVHTNWKSAIIEGAAVVLCPVEVLSRRQTQHQHKHIAHPDRTAGHHGIPGPAAQSPSRSTPISHSLTSKHRRQSIQHLISGQTHNSIFCAEPGTKTSVMSDTHNAHMHTHMHEHTSCSKSIYPV